MLSEVFYGYLRTYFKFNFFRFTFNEMVVALVNSPFQTAASCAEANREETAAINQVFTTYI